ncbi:MAG: ParB N-terminal domain-containing protein [Candidatus Saccharibacteria bacterium]|nr:ParB N-terminal domain-containing protein [Rhodoferax sp.]
MKAISLAVCGQNRVVSAQKNVVSKDQSIGLAVVNQTPAEWVLDPSCAAFPPMQHDEFIALRASIQRNGQNEPILVWGNRIIDGRHRLRACQELGIEPMLKRLTGDYQQAVSMAFAANVNRRQLGTGQLALLGAQLATRRPGQTKAAKHVEAVLSQAEAATLFGVSRDAIQKASRLILQKNAALLDAVHNGSMTLNEAYVTANTGKTGLRAKTSEAERKALRMAAAVKERLGKESRTLRLVKQAAISAKNVALPTGSRHSVILADPPWDYGMPNDRAASRVLPHEQYITLTIDAICDMGVADIAADDSMLFMWCPASLLPDGLKVMAAWGFDYSSNWVWHKEGQLNCGGGTAAIHHELLLVGRRGAGLTISDKKLRGSSVFGGQVKAHSAKPVVVHERLEALYPGVSRIELFSRAQRAGWTMYGNQVDEVAAERKVA